MCKFTNIMKKVKLLLFILLTTCSIVLKGQQKEDYSIVAPNTQTMPYPA